MSTDAEIADFVRGPATNKEGGVHGFVQLKKDGAVTMKGLRLIKSITPREGLHVSITAEACTLLTSEELVTIAESASVDTIGLWDATNDALATLGNSGSRVSQVTVMAISDNRVSIDAVTCLASLKDLRQLNLHLLSPQPAEIWKLGAFNTCPKFNRFWLSLDKPISPDLLPTLKAVRASLPNVEKITIAWGDRRAEQFGADGAIFLHSKGQYTILPNTDPAKIIVSPLILKDH
jgi:hypothetical protein